MFFIFIDVNWEVKILWIINFYGFVFMNFIIGFSDIWRNVGNLYVF